MDPRQSFISSVLIDVAEYLHNEVGRKASYNDIKGYLAEADVVADKYIKSMISKHFPDNLILSEEDTGFSCLEIPSNNFLWILDPICGTTNYSKGIPLYVHSLSVLDNNGVLYAGIYDPNRKELFLADRNITTLNGQRVTVSKTIKLDEAILAVNCNQSAWMDGGLTIVDMVTKFAPPITRRVKIFESANLELAYVACGRLDGYISPTDKVWDIAAGTLMISSAGGRVKHMNGSLLPPFEINMGIITTNSFLMESIEKQLI